MIDVKPDVTLDCKGLSCPMPIIKMKAELKKMKSGQILLTLGTDPGTKNDIPGMCKKEGHELIGIDEEGGIIKFYIKKG
jgi:tRNA 2-thiouridine synthesizing protein A